MWDRIVDTLILALWGDAVSAAIVVGVVVVAAVVVRTVVVRRGRAVHEDHVG